MILSIVRFYGGGVSYEYLKNAPLSEVNKIAQVARKIKKLEDRK